MLLLPLKHESMTVITYSNPARTLPKEIQIQKHLSACRNVPKSRPEMLDPSEKLILECCGVKGLRWTEEKGDWKTEGGAKGDNVQRERQTWGLGHNKWRMNRGRESLPKLCNDSKWGNRNDMHRSWKDKTDASGMLSVAEKEGEIAQRERENNLWPIFLWLLSLKNISEQKMKRQNIMRMRWRHILFWLPLLFLSLCPKPASSQVRAA